MHLRLEALSLALVALASTAPAQTLYVTHEGVGSGTLNGVAFASTPFTIHCDFGINTVQSPLPGVLTVDHSSASIDISGVGTFNFVTPTGTFNNQNVLPVVGFGRANAGADLFNGPFDSVFATWDLASPIGPVVGTANILQWGSGHGDIVTSGGVLVLDNANNVPCTFTASFSPGGLGTNYCAAASNSTGSAGTISGAGSAVVAQNNLTLEADDLPNNSFGYFLTSTTQGFMANPGGSSGNLCLGGSIGRYVGPGQIKNSGSTGSFSLLLNLSQTPQPAGAVAIAAGQTWNFQSWYRDAVGGAATSNFTNGLSVQFQ